MPLRASRRTEALVERNPRRWRISLSALISLLIHVAIGVLLLVTIPREERSELLPPPAPVTMVFEGGRKSGPTLPQPDLQATPAAPAAPETPHAAEAPSAEPPPIAPGKPEPLEPSQPLPVPAPPVDTPPAPAVPAPPPVPVPPPVQASQIQQPRTLTPPEAEPKPVPPPLPVEAATPTPPPPPEAAPSLPTPPVPAPKATPAAPQPPKPVTKQSPKPSDFPAPMDLSFGKGPSTSRTPSRSASRPHFPGQIDMSLGPAAKGTADPTPFGDETDAAGADWRNALSRWVSEHAYYPPEARRDFQEGDSKVHVTMMPDGRVKEVELVGRSGSVWLDTALLALFRNQHIPPLPSGQTQPFEFDFTMHYILIRR